MKGMKAHSPEQEMILAEFYPKSQIAHMMGGLIRNYYSISSSAPTMNATARKTGASSAVTER